jgi:hypothetical protein
VDNGDGTVTDNKTGLMWEKKSAAGTGDVHDAGNLYTWSATGSNADGSLYTDFLPQLNDTICFAGYCDWRIPKLGELRSILTAEYPNCTSAPCIDPTFGPTQSSPYWPSSLAPGHTTVGFNVNFGSGNIVLFSFGNSAFARAVRSVR